MQAYVDQQPLWPASGRHILASFDETSIIVYQAYRPSTGRFAAEHGAFGGPDFSLSRMSWIKPNFLWMMYRSGWGTKPGQEVTLALRLRRDFFDSLLKQAVPSSHDVQAYTDREDWQRAVGASAVRLQWDPDHDPSGRPLQRRAIQLGLRGSVLEAYAGRELLSVADISEFVAEQRELLQAGSLDQIQTPLERTYMPADPAIASKLGLETVAS